MAGRWILLGLGAVVALAGMTWAQEEVLDDLLKNAKPVTTAPTPVPDSLPAGAATMNGGVDPLGTVKAKAPREARTGVVTLSTGKAYEGHVWTTLATPVRVWVESVKMYRDIEWSLIKRVDVNVIEAVLEDDWRWLKEGSDQKVYSGKKYPNVVLVYKFTLLNDQVIEGTVVAPIYVFDGEKSHQLALYKKYKGELGQTLKDVVYIKSIVLSLSNATAELNEKKTTKLPLIVEGY